MARRLAKQWSLPILERFVGIGRVLHDGSRIFLDFLFKEIDTGLELGVAPVECSMGQVVDDDVGVDAMAFNQPLLAVDAVDAGLRCGGDAVVGLHVIAREPDFAAPGTRAKDLPELKMLKPSEKASPSEAVS